MASVSKVSPSGRSNVFYEKIKELEGHKEMYTNTADGRVVWKVVSQVLDDKLKDMREYKEKLFSDEKYNAYKNNTDDWDYNKPF